MTHAPRRWWTLPLVAVATLTGVASMIVIGGILLAPPDEPAPRPPVPVRPMPVAPRVEPVSDVHWDAAAAQSAEELPAVPVTPGDEFRVTSEVGDEAVAAAVLAASRRALPLTLELLGGEPRPQRRPYEVCVVRTRDRIKEEARRIAWTPPAGVVGFADLVNSRICLTSDDLDAPADVLALAGPGSFLTMVAGHEAVHQAAGRCIAGAGGAADWLCEGIAEYVGEQVVMETYPGTEVGAVPYFSQQMRSCQDLLAAGTLPTAVQILAERLDRLDDGSRYAIYWAFFRYLNDASQRDRTKAMIAQVRRLPWSADGAAKIAGIVDGVWGAGGQQSLTAGFRDYVAAFVPQWNSVGGRLEVSGTTWTQVGTVNAPAKANRCGQVGRRSYRISGAVEILPRGDRIARVLIGGRPAGSVYVGFEAGKGVGLWNGDGTSTELGPPIVFESERQPAVGRRGEFAIDVASEKVRVSFDGSQVLEWNPRGRDMTGPWGVDCSNFTGSRTPTNSAAIWYGVRLE